MIHRPVTTPVLLAMAAAAFGVAPTVAQDDVELWGLPYGTRPPPAYYARRAIDPDAFTFGRAWMARNPSLVRQGTDPDGTPIFGVRPFDDPPVDPFAARAEGIGTSSSVNGTFQVPLILGYYSDSPLPAFLVEDVQREFFDGPNSYHKTIEEYYAEVSGGAIDFQGDTYGWAQATLTAAQVVGSSFGLGTDAQVGLFIIQLLTVLDDDGSIDWGQYDNDGPDGLPNSGDDDGFVDVLAVFQPSWGAECGGAGQSLRVWSHKWRLTAATGQSFVTKTVATGGGLIRIDDYAIQPLLDCGSQTKINRIGVLAHELGHAFGLPDQYAVGGGSHAAAGAWALMATGSWGCLGGGEAERPCHMNAWSKSMLGWVEVETLAPDMDHGLVTIPAVELAQKVYRVAATDGSGEYFLLENRQREGFDLNLAAPGLLVWHIDADLVAERWPSNTVNSDREHMGIWLRQADGLNQLAQPGSSDSNRADSGDPFPGSTANTELHASSNPATVTHAGNASGLTLLDIRLAGTDVTTHILTDFYTITVRTEGDGGLGTLTVNGSPVAPSGHSFQSAAFEEHRLEVTGGTEFEEGRRLGFLGWSDDPAAPKVRTFVAGFADQLLVAMFGGMEARVRLEVEGEQFGVPPGIVAFTPPAPVEADGRWFPEGSAVLLEAQPTTGFGFEAWTGALAGQTNPATLLVDGPKDVGVTFELTYAIPDELTAQIEAGSFQELTLVAENANLPVSWFLEGGTLPGGLEMSQAGRFSGVPLETGSFPIQVRAQDSFGLSATGTIVLEVVAPSLSVTDLTGPFLFTPSDLTFSQREYLDFDGNRNGVYDLGDFRAYFLATGGMVTVNAQRVAGPRVLPVDWFEPTRGNR